MIHKTAVIYSNDSQESLRVIELLKHLGGKFKIYRLNEHFSQRAFEEEFGKESTYPQVAIGSRHIGNLKETLQYMNQRGLLCAS